MENRAIAAPLQSGQKEVRISGQQKTSTVPRRVVLTVNGTSRLSKNQTYHCQTAKTMIPLKHKLHHTTRSVVPQD